MKIWKEKQYIYILREGGTRPYAIDFEQGCIIGLNNAPLKRISSVLRNECWIYGHKPTTPPFEKVVCMFLYDIEYILNTQYISSVRAMPYYLVFNTLLSISAENTYKILKSSSYNIRYIYEKLNDKQRKDFFKAFSKNELNLDNGFSISNYLDEIANKEIEPYLAKSHKHFTANEIEDLKCACRNLEPKAFDIFFYLAERHWLSLLVGRTLGSLVASYCNMCKELEVNPKKEKDFVTEYAKIQNLHRIKEMQISDKKIQDFLVPLKDKLSFEDEDFQVVVPMSKQEYLDEGKMQNNCVASMYLKKVENQERIVVFIRKKDNLEKSFISCEIYKEDFSIGQYLAKNNDYVRDEKAIQFREKYAEHLKNNFLI